MMPAATDGVETSATTQVDCPRCFGSGDRCGVDCIPCHGSGKVSPERHAELMDPFGTIGVAPTPADFRHPDTVRLDWLEQQRNNSRAKGFQWDAWNYKALESEQTIREQLDAALGVQPSDGGQKNG